MCQFQDVTLPPVIATVSNPTPISSRSFSVIRA
jgi:hypothetical protein